MHYLGHTYTNTLFIVYLRFKFKEAKRFFACMWGFCFVFWQPAPVARSPTPARGRHTTGGKFQGEHAALMKVQLVFLWLADVQDLDVTALHADGQPVLVGAMAQGKYLGVKREKVGSITPCDCGGCPEEELGGGKRSRPLPLWPPHGEAAGPRPGSSRQLHVKSLILISITRNPGASHPLSARNTQQRGQSLPLSRWWKGS